VPLNPHRPRQSVHHLWFRGGLVFKARGLLYHSTIGLRVIKKKTKDVFIVVGTFCSSARVVMIASVTLLRLRKAGGVFETKHSACRCDALYASGVHATSEHDQP